jgi:glycosyltransferase involved in cell wall biosynthesis
MVVSNDVVHDSRVLKEGRALADAGHEVSFLGWDRSGGLASEEEWQGLRVTRVRTSDLAGRLRRDVIRNPLWWRAATRAASRAAFDVVHCHDLDTLPIGVRLKRRLGRRLVYDAHEVFGYMIEEDQPSLVVDYAFRMEARLAPFADRVIAVNEAVKAYIDRVSRTPATIVMNAQDPAVAEYRPPPAGPFTVLYIGTLHKSRFILPAIEVVGDMPEVRLVIGGSKALTETVRERCARHANTPFLGLVPAERVLPLTLDSHAVLTMFDPVYRINQVGLPNKIFEAMSAGRPSLVTQGLPMAGLVEREDCGLAVPYTKDGFRAAVERLRDDPKLAERLGRNGLAAAQRTYNWTRESRKLVALYEDLSHVAARPGA